MKNSFLISTGGSGGHVIPAIILNQHLSKKFNTIISTDKRGLKYIDDEIKHLEIINTPKLNNIFLLPINLVIIFYLTYKSYFLLKRKKIKKIFSTGGYMSLPLVLAAKFLRLDIYLIEPNRVIGRANKFFLNYCRKIFCYTDQVRNFPDSFKNKIVTINPLVRENIYKLKPSDKIKDKFTLLIVGGSQGAEIFDENLKDTIVDISKKNHIRVIHQTNEKNVSALSNFYSNNNIESKIFSFDKNFSNNLQQADLCITRSGASTIAELSVLSVPFIAVPLPTSKDNHQFENANFYKNKDCCWVIDQDSFKIEIKSLLEKILSNKSVFYRKKENFKKLNYQNTWNNVNQKILSSINEN